MTSEQMKRYLMSGTHDVASATSSGVRPPHRVPVRAGLGAGLIAIAAMLFGAGSAGAHGSGADSSNYVSLVTGDGAPGLAWTVDGFDSKLVLDNRTAEEVIVLGYENEPYLRFTPGQGVFENLRSPAAWLNRDRFGQTPVPPEADPAARPVWDRVAHGDRYGWHDHRVHWMAPGDPPSAADGSGRDGLLVLDWAVPVLVGTSQQAVSATGQLRWVEPVDWRPPVIITGLGFGAVVAAALVMTRPNDGRWPGLARPAVVLLVAVVAANAVRIVDDIVSSEVPLGQDITVGVIAGLSALIVALLCVRSWSGDRPGALGAAVVLVVLTFGGEASGQLSASQLLTSLPTWVRRWTVAASYSIALAVGVAVVGLLWRRPPHVGTWLQPGAGEAPAIDRL